MDDSGNPDLSKLGLDEAESRALIAELEKEMLQAAEALEFERAAVLRDRLKSLQKTSRRS